MQVSSITRIDKSLLATIPFKKEEILQRSDEITLRYQDLTRGMALGNLFKETVRIQFLNAEGEPMETEATIWAVTEKMVVLKGGLTIPIHSISKVIV